MGGCVGGSGFRSSLRSESMDTGHWSLVTWGSMSMSITVVLLSVHVPQSERLNLSGQISSGHLP